MNFITTLRVCNQYINQSKETRLPCILKRSNENFQQTKWLHLLFLWIDIVPMTIQYVHKTTSQKQKIAFFEEFWRQMNIFENPSHKTVWLWYMHHRYSCYHLKRRFMVKDACKKYVEPSNSSNVEFPILSTIPLLFCVLIAWSYDKHFHKKATVFMTI